VKILQKVLGGYFFDSPGTDWTTGLTGILTNIINM